MTEKLEVCPLCGTDDILYPSVAEEYRNEIELLNRAAELEAENERLREEMSSALVAIWRKDYKEADDILRAALEAAKEVSDE